MNSSELHTSSTTQVSTIAANKDTSEHLANYGAGKVWITLIVKGDKRLGTDALDRTQHVPLTILKEVTMYHLSFMKKFNSKNLTLHLYI